MKEEYVKLIASTDKLLHEFREFWLGAIEPKDKARWMAKLNEGLDERFRLMTCRDLA